MHASSVAFALPLLAGVIAAQQAPPWVRLQKVEIRGVEAFGVDQIREALALQTDVVAAMASGDPTAATRAIGEVVADGYRAGGFVDVEVKVGPELQITVVEGPRRRCGEIVFSGNTKVPAAELLERMRSLPDEVADWDWAGTGPVSVPRQVPHWLATWRPDEPAHAGSAGAKALGTIVRKAYEECGYPAAKVDAAFEAAGDLVRAHVVVRDEGDQVHVASLGLVGERAKETPLVLQRLQWQPGAVLTTTLRLDVERQLLRTGRYALVKCDRPRPGQTVLDPLVVRVQRVEYAAGFDEAAQRDYAQAVRGVESLRKLIRGGSGIHGGADIPAGAGFGLPLAPGRFDLTVGQHSARLALENLPGVDGGAPFACSVSPKALLLVHGRRWASLPLEGRARVGLTFTSRPDRGQGSEPVFDQHELKWGFMVTEALEDRVLFAALHPTLASYLLNKPETPGRREGENLVVALGGATVTIAPDGSFTPRSLVFGPMTLDFPPAQELDLEAEIAALPAAGRVAVGTLLAMPVARILMGMVVDAEAPAANALLDVAVRTDFGGELALDTKPPARRFDIDDERRRESMRTPKGIASTCLTMAACNLAGETWPARILGAGEFLMLDNGSELAARWLFALRQEPRLGPLALGSAALALQMLGFERAAVGVRQQAVERCTFESFFVDLLEATPPDGRTERILRAVGRQWRTDPATAATCAAPAGPAATEADLDLAAARRGLQVLWDAGLGRTLRGWLGGAAK